MRIVDVFQELHPPFNRQDANIHDDWIDSHGLAFHRKLIGEEAYQSMITTIIDNIPTDPKFKKILETSERPPSSLETAEVLMREVATYNMRVDKAVHKALTAMLKGGYIDIDLYSLVQLHLAAVDMVNRKAVEGLDDWEQEFDTFNEITSSLE